MAAETIKLMVYDPCMPEVSEYEMSMNHTLNDLVADFREEDSPSFGEVTELYVTVKGELIPMKTKVAKLIQDGLISDGSYIVIQVRGWPSMILTRSTCRSC